MSKADQKDPASGWSGIESGNLREYLARLRGSGCPESLVQGLAILELRMRCADRRARGLRGYDKNSTLLKILTTMNPTQPPWSDRFPTLAAISETLPPLPIGCVIERNVAIGTAKPIDIHGNVKELSVLTQRDNVAAPIEDLGFADVAKLDFRMDASAAAVKTVPSFTRIPFDKIGLYTNELRPVLPTHPAGTSNPQWGKP